MTCFTNEEDHSYPSTDKNEVDRKNQNLKKKEQDLQKEQAARESDLNEARDKIFDEMKNQLIMNKFKCDKYDRLFCWEPQNFICKFFML